MKKASEILGKGAYGKPVQLSLTPQTAKSIAAPATISPQVKDLLDASEMIRGNWPRKDEMAFLAKHLVQVTLPHSDPGNVEIWTRCNGHLTLSIVRVQRDAKNGRLIGYPYGTIPRLLLYWLTSEAVRTKSRTVKLGNTLSQFMKEVGLNPETGGGKRSDAVRLREQMTRLFASSISFQYAEEGQGTSWLNMPVTRRAQLWWNPTSPHQGDLFESWIELGEDFYEAITNGPVPLDTRALKALNHSAMALDLYAWATHKAHVLLQTRDSQFVSYVDLHGQLGSEYADIKNFKKKLHIALRQVAVVYPKLNFSKGRGGLIMHPSRPSVPYTAGRSPQVFRNS